MVEVDDGRVGARHDARNLSDMAALRALHLYLVSQCECLSSASAAARAGAAAARARSRRLQMPTLRLRLAGDETDEMVRRRVGERFAHHPAAVLDELKDAVSRLTAGVYEPGAEGIDLRVCERPRHFHVGVNDDRGHRWAYVPHDGALRPALRVVTGAG
jgi:hypothetical protein